MAQKHWVWISTGGTIAGVGQGGGSTRYEAGALSGEALLGSIPALHAFGHIRTVQPYSIPSQHLNAAHWLALRDAVETALVQPDVKGIVITHGTDTLEETAFFLHVGVAALSKKKPIVLTAAMRPATAVSADGPANLVAAFTLASHLAGRSAQAKAALSATPVWMCMNNAVYSALHVHKHHAWGPSAFEGETPDGFVLDEHVVINRLPWCEGWEQGRCAGQWQALPEVPLLFMHADMHVARLKAFFRPLPRGIVLAGFGHGALPKGLYALLEKAQEAGCWVVRSSRAESAGVLPAVENNAQVQLLCAGRLNPYQARTALQLCLASGQAWPASLTPLQ